MVRNERLPLVAPLATNTPGPEVTPSVTVMVPPMMSGCATVRLMLPSTKSPVALISPTLIPPSPTILILPALDEPEVLIVPSAIVPRLVLPPFAMAVNPPPLPLPADKLMDTVARLILPPAVVGLPIV